MARGSQSMILPVDLSGLESLFDGISDAADGAVRPAAQAAAQVLYDAAKANVARLGRVTGNLARSIYQAYSQDNSGASVATYHVSWRPRQAPHAGLVEYGYWQRYEYLPDGMGPKVRPGMESQPRPTRRSSRSYKDSYWVPREGGPVYVPGKAFMRRALSAAPQATHAAQEVLLAAIQEVK